MRTCNKKLPLYSWTFLSEFRSWHRWRLVTVNFSPIRSSNQNHTHTGTLTRVHTHTHTHTHTYVYIYIYIRSNFSLKNIFDKTGHIIRVVFDRKCHLTLGWHEFRKAPYVSQVLSTLLSNWSHFQGSKYSKDKLSDESYIFI